MASFIASTTASVPSDSATSLTINAPSPIAAGNLLIAAISGASSPTPPSGWTLQFSTSSFVNMNGLMIFTKTATASEPSTYTWAWTGSAYAVGIIVEYSNAVLAATFVSTYGVVGPGSGTPNPNTEPFLESLTGSPGETLVGIFVEAHGGGGWVNNSPQMSSRTSVGPISGLVLDGILWADAPVTASGATPNYSWNVIYDSYWGTVAFLLYSPPGAPTLTSPANATYLDVASGTTFEATFNSSDGQNMTAYAMRIKTSSGSYQYWNAGTNALQSSIVWNNLVVTPGGTITVSLPSGALSDGNTYNWSIAAQGSLGSVEQGPFASDFTFIAQTTPTVVVTPYAGGIASGTTQPVVAWTETLPPSTGQVTYSVIVESGSYGTTPGSGTTAWSSGTITSTDLQVQVGTPLVSGTTYRFFVQITITGSQPSNWGYTTATVQADVPNTPTVTALASADGLGTPVVALSIQAYDNYLDANDSNFEGTGSGSVGSWVAGSNTSIAASDNFALNGAWSLELTPSAAGTISATCTSYSVIGGASYAIMAALRAGVTARPCTLNALWYEGGTYLSTSVVDPVDDPTTGFINLEGIVMAPANANKVEIQIVITGTSGSSDVHYMDCVGLFPPLTVSVIEGGSASSTGPNVIDGGNAASAGPTVIYGGSSTQGIPPWSVGGFAGLTSVIVTRSDGLQVRWASSGNPLAVPAVGQTAVVYDYEVPPLTSYTYTAVVQVASLTLTSPSSTASDSVELSTTSWYEFDPTLGTATSNPSASTANMVDWSPVSTEQSTANQVTNQSTMNIVANAMMNQDFEATAELFTDDIYKAFNSLLLSQKTVYISSPWGSLDSGYFRLGPQSGGMSSGFGTKAKQTTLMPSVAGSGHRKVAVTAVAQPRPTV
ncbi:MAG: hypothetical protein KGL39_04335 [Patescibacteria group bacterium]|nr:hypothetical protein [Patescibacteria group bacterium]